MLKLSQIEEGLWKKGFERNEAGERRIEDLDGLSQEEFKIYELLKEWCTGGQLNITVGLAEPRHKFKGNWTEFQNNLYSSLKKLNCKELYSKDQIKTSVYDKYAVIYTVKNILGVENKITMVGFVDEKQTNLYTHYFSEDNVDLILNNFYKKYYVDIKFNESDRIYKAFRIPLKPFEKMIKQNKKMQNF